MDPIVYTTKPNPSSLPGFWEPNPEMVPALSGPNVHCLPGFTIDELMIVENALSAADCDKLIDLMKGSNALAPVGVQGMMDENDTEVGSMRTSVWSPKIAQHLWWILSSMLDVKRVNSKTATDWWQHLSINDRHRLMRHPDQAYYQPVAVSPLLRFMRYENGGQHYAHYDAGFIYPDPEYRTLKSVVIYLTTNESAATRFISDDQSHKDVWDRSHVDWSRPVGDHEVLAESPCIKGNILIFDHRMCHDVEKYLGSEPRVIIRGDIVYKLHK